MCQSIADGGKRCPSNRGARRRAYQRARYAAGAVEAAYAEGFSAPPVYTPPTEAVAGDAVGPARVHALSQLGYDELRHARTVALANCQQARRDVDVLSRQMGIDDPSVGWADRRTAILAAAPTTVAGIHVAHDRDYAALAKIERAHVDAVRKLGAHTVSLSEYHAAGEFKKIADADRERATARAWAAEEMTPAVRMWHESLTDDDSMLARLRRDPHSVDRGELAAFMAIYRGHDDGQVPESIGEINSLVNELNYAHLGHEMSVADAVERAESTLTRPRQREMQRWGLQRALSEVTDYYDPVDDSYLVDDGDGRGSATVRSALAMMPSSVKRYIADTHDELRVISAEDGEHGFYTRTMALRGDDGETVTVPAIRTTTDLGLCAHELGHALDSHPYVHAATKRYLSDRTEGCAETAFTNGPVDAMVKADGFAISYIGRDYPGTPHTEIASTGLQFTIGDGGLLHDRDGNAPDPDHRDFAIGLLAGFPDAPAQAR